jgi:hypothetical protein
MRSLVCLLAFALSCGNSSSPIPRCIPGSTEACLCASGSMGRQVCQGDGTYDTCTCSSPSGGDGGSSVADGGAPPNGGLRVLDASGVMLGYLVDTSHYPSTYTNGSHWVVFSPQHDVMFRVEYEQGRLLSFEGQDPRDAQPYWSGRDCTGRPLADYLSPSGLPVDRGPPLPFVHYRVVGTVVEGSSLNAYLYEGPRTPCQSESRRRTVSLNSTAISCINETASGPFLCRTGAPTTILPTSWPAPLRLSL